MTSAEILKTLDNYNVNPYWSFFSLNHPYSYTIDSRLNIFKNSLDQWAIVCEVLGYNPRAECITLELTYLGNCLINLPVSDNNSCNQMRVMPVDWEHFQTTVEVEVIKPEAEYWLVRGEKVPISHSKEEYTANGIELKEFESPGDISPEEAGRLAILKYAHLFRVMDEELYQCLPDTLKKIMVIDEWYHREFNVQHHMFNDPAFLNQFDTGPEQMKQYVLDERIKLDQYNQEEWEKNRPGSYETWQQIAEVISTGDVLLYKPTLKPNSHWTNWPESGSL